MKSRIARWACSAPSSRIEEASESADAAAQVVLDPWTLQVVTLLLTIHLIVSLNAETAPKMLIQDVRYVRFKKILI